jgi:hypothetical protein
MKKILLSNQWVIEKNQKENFKFLESNENENTTYQNLCGTGKTMVRRNFIAVGSCIKKSQ